MWEWLQQNAQLISALGSITMVFIWLLYLQLFYLQFRRQRKPCLVIHHEQGNGPSDLCLLVNMSSEPIHVQCILAKIRVEDRTVTRPVTELGEVSPTSQQLESTLRQGPICPGDYLVLGTLERIVNLQPLIEEQMQAHSEETEQSFPYPLDIEIRIVAVHGPSDHLVGACRRFNVRRRENKWVLDASQFQTDQLSSHRHLKTVEKWVEEYSANTVR